MHAKKVAVITAVAVLGVAAAGTGVAVGTGAMRDDHGPDVPIEEPVLSEASRIAIDHVGGGRVTGTEAGDEESYYEVEVTKPDGGQVDVQLDKDLHVVGSSADEESSTDRD
jgi:hypothetical protein